MANIEIHVPDIGDFDEVTVIELLVKVGDTIHAEQSLIAVESDKASMEIPSAAAGVVTAIKVALGDKVKQGSVVVMLEVAAAAPAPTAVPAPAPAPVAVPAPVASAPAAAAPATAPTAAPASMASAPAAINPPQALVVAVRPAAPAHMPGTPAPGLPHASPSVRKFARELGVPIDEVKGSGPKGRITQDDVHAFTKAVMAGATQTKIQAARAPCSPRSKAAITSASRCCAGVLPRYLAIDEREP